jgi:hypothetical protein
VSLRLHQLVRVAQVYCVQCPGYWQQEGPPSSCVPLGTPRALNWLAGRPLDKMDLDKTFKQPGKGDQFTRAEWQQQQAKPRSAHDCCTETDQHGYKFANAIRRQEKLTHTPSSRLAGFDGGLDAPCFDVVLILLARLCNMLLAGSRKSARQRPARGRAAGWAGSHQQAPLRARTS